MNADTSLVEVYRARNGPQAHLIKAVLEEAGIRAQVTGEMLQGAFGAIPLGWATVPRIVVREADSARAREILQQLDDAKVT